jgi:hypothetical protein
MPIQAGIAVASATVSAVTQIKDTNKRREVELAISRLSYRDQRDLNEKVARAKNQNERLAILIQEVNRIKIEQEKEKTKRDTRNAILIIGGALVVLVAVVLLKRK